MITFPSLKRFNETEREGQSARNQLRLLLQLAPAAGEQMTVRAGRNSNLGGTR